MQWRVWFCGSSLGWHYHQGTIVNSLLKKRKKKYWIENLLGTENQSTIVLKSFSIWGNTHELLWFLPIIVWYIFLHTQNARELLLLFINEHINASDANPKSLTDQFWLYRLALIDLFRNNIILLLYTLVSRLTIVSIFAPNIAIITQGLTFLLAFIW